MVVKKNSRLLPSRILYHKPYILSYPHGLRRMLPLDLVDHWPSVSYVVPWLSAHKFLYRTMGNCPPIHPPRAFTRVRPTCPPGLDPPREEKWAVALIVGCQIRSCGYRWVQSYLPPSLHRTDQFRRIALNVLYTCTGGILYGLD